MPDYNLPDRNAPFYQKRGRRYEEVKVGDHDLGFPCDGVWLVQTKKYSRGSRRILTLEQVSGVPDRIQLAAMVAQYEDEIYQALQELWKSPYSAADLVQAVIDAIAEAGFKQAVQDSDS